MRNVRAALQHKLNQKKTRQLATQQLNSAWQVVQNSTEVKITFSLGKRVTILTTVGGLSLGSLIAWYMPTDRETNVLMFSAPCCLMASAKSIPKPETGNITVSYVQKIPSWEDLDKSLTK